MTGTLYTDQAFIERLTEIVSSNLQNENFGVNDLAREAGLSRSIIHRRLRAIKDQNISQFIREIRLKRAMELLQEHAGAASDIAFKVGFGSPAYFNKCFHEYYGYPPGEVRKRIHPEEGVKHESVPANLGVSKELQTGVKSGPVKWMKVSRRMTILLSITALVVLALTLVIINGSRRKAKDLSIFILPFKNFTNDPENQYIVDGIMEDVLNNLYHISELRVVSRTTSEHYRGTNLTAKAIAKAEDVRNILEGSMRQYGDKTRISVQLIDAYRDNHLWSENFDRDTIDINTFEGEIALIIANRLNAEISDDEIRQIREIPTQNPVAKDYYLRGRFLLNKTDNEQRADINKEGLIGSIKYFEKAVAADENFAEAYAGMASAWSLLSGWGWLPFKEGFSKARDLCMKALEIDPDCAEAHAVKGSIYIWGERRFEEGRKELLISLQLNPNCPPVHQSYTQLLMITGPIDEARIYMDRALKLEPYYWVLHNLNAWIYYFEERYKEAIGACLLARDLKPDYIYTNWLLFLNYAKLDEGMKAAEELKEIVRVVTRTSQYDDEIMDAYNRSGVEGLFTWLIDININNPVPAEGLSGHPFFIAWWYAITGDRENSVYWLERNMEAKRKVYEYFNLIATNPDFDILRGDPRFLAIIDQIGLTPYNNRPAK
ncbi:MAG: helix-turn-helix domain-containing protein [Bacteroidales bacterium]|nr:helix-turn-helix domain-containing protein [Bacteroidales bacterium]